jgi:hypothetical protein
MIEKVKLGTFGMYEMEMAANKIIYICRNSEARWAQRFSILDMESEHERIGFTELLYSGWLEHGTYNGEFYSSKSFIKRVEEYATRRFKKN